MRKKILFKNAKWIKRNELFPDSLIQDLKAEGIQVLLSIALTDSFDYKYIYGLEGSKRKIKRVFEKNCYKIG
ncbi:hypothetical protein VJY32_08505 [Ignavibacteria bacterium 4148-Me]|uniref:hypothetical protein n=1 Tax=Rosettibacter primus TaxID=3111523 RepID=UPI00336C1B86